jgi:hypothetical protein
MKAIFANVQQNPTHDTLLQKIETIIGYEFCDMSLFEKALNYTKYPFLDLIGDKIVGITVELFMLTRFKDHSPILPPSPEEFVENAVLAKLSEDLGIQEIPGVGRSIRHHYASILEAIIGSVLIDQLQQGDELYQVLFPTIDYTSKLLYRCSLHDFVEQVDEHILSRIGSRFAQIVVLHKIHEFDSLSSQPINDRRLHQILANYVKNTEISIHSHLNAEELKYVQLKLNKSNPNFRKHQQLRDLNTISLFEYLGIALYSGEPLGIRNAISKIEICLKDYYQTLQKAA